jgi:hypothetical protein
MYSYSGSMFVPAPPETVIQKIVLWGSGERQTTCSVSSGMVMFNRPSKPGWAVFLAILLFPIGLLALVAKQDNVLTLIALPVEGGTQVSASGVTSEYVGGRLNALWATIPAPALAR